MRLSSVLLGVVAALISPILTRAIPEADVSVIDADSYSISSNKVERATACGYSGGKKGGLQDHNIACVNEADATYAAVPTPDSADDQVVYCSYAYSEKGLRGEHEDLKANYGHKFKTPMHSIIILDDCVCVLQGYGDHQVAFYSGWQGDLKFAAGEAMCAKTIPKGTPPAKSKNSLRSADSIPATNFKRTQTEAYCGYVYSEVGLRGKQTPLPTDGDGKVHHKVMNSAIITWDCTCDFYRSGDCFIGHKNGAFDHWRTGMFQGNLPWASECVICHYNAAAARSISDTQARPVEWRPR